MPEEWVSFDEDQQAKVEACVEDLLADSKGVAVLFANAAGQPVGHAGRLSEKDKTALATLSAGSFAATMAMAKLLGQVGAFDRVFFEGQEYSVHSSAVSEDFLLTVVFDRQARAGLVRLLAQEAAKKLLKIVGEAKEHAADRSFEDLIDAEFGDSLADQLDALLPGDGQEVE
jgi:predicted regulator of Ras-like GTPase activity (Roadblock/LC7/MglB family)